MRWKTIFFVILVTVSVQTVIIKAQGFLDPFGLRRRSKERRYESQEEENGEGDNPEQRRTFFGLDLLKPFDINFGSRREADGGRQRDKERKRKQDSQETLEDASTGELPMGRSLDFHHRKGNDESSSRDREPEEEDNSPESKTGKQVEYGPCGPNNQYCDGENYIKELGLTWSNRVHNGTGIYLRDPNVPGGKRYVLVGIDLPNEKYDYCTTPKNEPGYCRHLEHCVLDDFRSSFIKFLEYLCDIPNQNYVGTCCPRSKDSRKPEGRVPPTTTPRTPPSEGREMRPLFPPFDLSPQLPFRPLTTTAPPRRRTTNRSRGGAAGGPQHRQLRDCGQAEKKMSRIVGGRTADPKAWPWMTALLKTSEATDHRAGQYCGGVLITEFHVLTAAHCVDLGSDIKYLSVRVGEYDFSRRNATSSPDDIPVSEVFIHDKFNRYTYENDIAVIKLVRSAFYDQRIKYICLPEFDDKDDSFVNEKGIVTGFGTIWYGGPTSDTLQEITVPIWKQEDCQAAYSQPIEDTNLCAGVQAGSRDSCQGDSGGPLQVQLKGRWTIVGIVSWGIRCSEPGYPGVYTRVNSYLEWIASQIKR